MHSSSGIIIYLKDTSSRSELSIYLDNHKKGLKHLRKLVMQHKIKIFEFLSDNLLGWKKASRLPTVLQKDHLWREHHSDFDSNQDEVACSSVLIGSERQDGVKWKPPLFIPVPAGGSKGTWLTFPKTSRATAGAEELPDFQ